MQSLGLPRLPPLRRRDALFLDVDGTLIDLAARPDRVATPPALVATLRRLSGRLGGAIALVSGRSVATLDRLFRPWMPPAAGLHGAEMRRRFQGSPVTPAGETEPLARLRPAIGRLAAGRPGLLVEDKGRALALHYRAAPGEGQGLAAELEGMRRVAGGGIALQPGKMVLELRPADADKGRALDLLMRLPRFRSRRPVFIGDDRTDEAGFRAARRLGGVGICVGDLETRAARYRIATPAALRRWLARQAGMLGAAAGTGR